MKLNASAVSPDIESPPARHLNGTHSEAKKQSAEIYLYSEVVVQLQRLRVKYPENDAAFLNLIEAIDSLAKALADEPATNVRVKAIEAMALIMRLVLDGDSSIDALRLKRALNNIV